MFNLSGTREPVAIINAIITVVQAIIGAVVLFGVDWTPEQVAGVLAVVVAVGEALKTLWARSQVTPVSNPRDNMGRPLAPVRTSWGQAEESWGTAGDTMGRNP